MEGRCSSDPPDPIKNRASCGDSDASHAAEDEMTGACFLFSHRAEGDAEEPLLGNPDREKMETDERRTGWALRKYSAAKGLCGYIDRYFCISERGSTISIEIGAGFACFLSASVALPVIPAVMSKSGIPLVDAISSLCLCSSTSCLITGLLGNLPFVLVPSLGMTIFFTYGMVSVDQLDSNVKELGQDGFGSHSLLFVGDSAPARMDLESAFACVLIAGVIMFVLTITYLVDKGMKYVPNFMKVATIAGIGMQVTFIGLESTGLIDNGKISDIMTLEAWPTWAALAGLLVMAVLSSANIRGSIIVGMVSVSFLYWSVRNEWPQQIVEVPSLSQSLLRIRFDELRWQTAVPAVATFLAVMLFDCSACLIGLSQQAGLIKDVKENVPGGTWALVACAVGTCLAACTGGTPLIISLDSSVGIIEGGRTGLTSVVAGTLFGLALFFAPIFSSVPQVASAPVLVLVGSMMMHDLGSVPWSNRKAALSTLLVLAISPMSRSIADGLGAGTACYLIMSLGELLLSPCLPPPAPAGPAAVEAAAAEGEEAVAAVEVRGGAGRDGGGVVGVVWAAAEAKEPWTADVLA